VQETEGDLTGWIEFAANAVTVARERAWNRIEVIRGESTASGETLILTPEQERLLTLFRHSPPGINDIMKELRVKTRAGAHHVIKPLIQHDLAARKGGYKTGKYGLC
jgi:hypothetical protein